MNHATRFTKLAVLLFVAAALMLAGCGRRRCSPANAA